MKATEILQAAEMYNKILEALNECEKVNQSSNYDDDLLWVECNNGTHYTNDLGDIMPNIPEDTDNYFTCHTMEETAAKFAELCLAVGCSPSDIYTSY